MQYSKLIETLRAYAEPNFADFQRRLIFTERRIIGVRTPILRKIAKEYQGKIDELFSFPNEYYEVVFIKLTVVSALPYEEFVKKVEECVSLMDNWALCDSFKAKCIHKHKEEFLPVLEKLFSTGKEYYERYAFVLFLAEYIEDKYLPMVISYIQRADLEPYYIYMAVAWLVAEILVKEYACGLEILRLGILDGKTHNKAIQKAIESYRINKEQKEYLRSLKIKIER